MDGVLKDERPTSHSLGDEEDGAAASQLRKSLEDRETQTELSQNQISKLIRHRDEAEASALAQLEQQKGEMNLSESSQLDYFL